MRGTPEAPRDIAVVIPAFNAAATIGDTLRSVYAQTLPAREVVVVDDGSTDDTARVASTCGARVISLPNRGAAAARNVGIANTTAPWIAFLDADDEWVPDKLERQSAGQQGRPMSYTDAWIVDGLTERRVSAIAPCPSGAILEALVLNNVITLSSVLVRRDVLAEAGGFPEALRVVHDWPLWLRIAAAHDVQFVGHPLVRYRVSPTGISRNLTIMEPEHLAVIEEAFSDGGAARHLPHLRDRALAGALTVVAHEAGRTSQWWLAARLALRRLTHCPGDLDAWKALTKVGLAASGVRVW
ncbi:MAG: glycosyltransferase family A protein [Vicinamibacterales bacterium]